MSKELMNISEITKYLELNQNISTFSQLLDTPPKKEWVKKNSFIKKEVNGKKEPIDFIPAKIIRKLRWMVFPQSKTEILSIMTVFNAVVVSVRFHYMHPVTGEWLFEDGASATDVQTQKGAKAMDAASINSNAVQKAVGSAKSYALKNALKEFGELFGGGLNDESEFGADMESVYAEPKPELSKEKAKNELDKINAVDKLQPLYDRLAAEHTMSYEIDEMFKARFDEITTEENNPPKAKPQPKKEAQPPIINDLSKSDEDRIKKALSKVYKASEINDVYAKMQSEGVNVKAFTNLFTESYKKLTNGAS